MKLQVKNKGAWKDVIEFSDQHLDAVLDAVKKLIDIDNGLKTAFRIVDECGDIVAHIDCFFALKTPPSGRNLTDKNP